MVLGGMWHITNKKMEVDEEIVDRRVLCQFKSETGASTGEPFDLPVNVTPDQLQALLNALLQDEENSTYAFFINDRENELTTCLSKTMESLDTKDASSESVIEIIYEPQAVFRVRAVTRCTSSIEGHAEAVISVQFSPDGRYLASGSGDCTVRFWDVNTETPKHTCKGHKHWVLVIAWSPDGSKLASADKNGVIMLWDPKTGQQIGRTMTGHRQWVTALSWRPLHLDGTCRHLASSSKDGTVKIWDTVLGKARITLSSHVQCVSCVRWTGTDLIYSGSQDRTIKVWRSEDGVMCRTLQGHGHWVNTMALSTDYVMRTGAFDPADATIVHREITETPDEMKELALKRYNKVKGEFTEMMVSGSDDFTMFLWTPATDKKPVARLTGHMQLINDVKFSPDCRLLASASFDKSIKIWDGRTGKYLYSFRGHVQRCYQVCWSADSRLMCSGSADSTLKVWNTKSHKIMLDLPGHADEVYAVDWSADGQRVASGGKDKILKIWRK